MSQGKIVHPSPFADIAIPRRTIGAHVFAGFAGREDAPALIDGASGRELSGRALVDAVARLAGGLAARGCGAGHVVAILAPNMPEYAVVFHGVIRAGGTITTINPSYTAEELRGQLVNAGAELLVTVPAFRRHRPGGRARHGGAGDRGRSARPRTARPRARRRWRR